MSAHSAVALLLGLVCLWSAARARPVISSSRRLSQEQGGDEATVLAQFLNAMQPQPTTLYQQWQGVKNDTLLTIRLDVSVRLAGARFVPFKLEDQRIFVSSFQTALTEVGPVEFTSYKEAWPVPGEPEGMREFEKEPFVDLSVTAYWVLNQTSVGRVNELFAKVKGELAFRTFLAVGATLASEGLGVPVPIFVNTNTDYFTGGFMLHPLIVLDLKLALDTANRTGGPALWRSQTDAVASALERDLRQTKLGTLVDIVGYTHDQDSSGGSGLAEGLLQVHLEVTLVTCKENATVAYPECEEQLLAAIFERLRDYEDVQQQWKAAGIRSVEVVDISPRKPPPKPVLNATAGGNTSWVPWHLDRIDQRMLPLDGKFTATATGTGVNVYIVSTGVVGNHEEFGYLDGRPGSRVKAAWGYEGLNPLTDCPDWAAWYGYGTNKASLCCGLKLGPAKNATIHSVRFRAECLSDSIIWSAGTLPAAMDLVLSTYKSPAVVLIDTWWGPDRPTGTDDAETVKKALTARLDQFQKENITVVAAAGPGLGRFSPCNNVIAAHPAVISVAATDVNDQATDVGPRNSTCINLWAPSGGVGTGLIGASPAGPANYSRIINRAFGSAAIVVGVAAQYLEHHPDATPAQVLEALQGMATPDIITDAGDLAPNYLLYTDLTEAVGVNSSGGGSSASSRAGGSASGSGGDSSGGGLSTGAIVGIVVGAVLAVVIAVAAAFTVIGRRRRWQDACPPKQVGLLEDSGWEVDPSDIEILRRPDGSEWVLGEGRLGKVYKALKGGVQVVAVKKLQLQHMSKDTEKLVKQAVATRKFVSRDANIVQFFGAAVEGDQMLLVAEFMEGGDLRSALAADKAGTLHWNKRGKEVMLDIVRGVHFLHANGVMQLDIRARHVLLARDGRAKLSDVGLSRLVGPNGSDTTRAPATLRVPAVLSKEKVSDKADLPDKIDIQALGAVLWELVTGEVPQSGSLREPEVPKECPQQVADAIRACTQPDPSLRPTARELYATLLACPPLVGDNGTLGPSCSSSDREGPGTGACKEGGPVRATADEIGSVGRTPQSSTNLWLEQACAGSADELEGSRQEGGPNRAQHSRPSRANSSSLDPSARPSRANSSSLDHSARPSRANSTNLELAKAATLSGNSSNLGLPLSASEMEMVAVDYSKLDFCRRPDGSLHKLGTGAFGAVYKVLLDGVQQLAAKEVELGADPTVQRSFMQEAGLLWRLRHRNIVGLMGMSISPDGKGYLLMELMEGGSLFNTLSAKSKNGNQRAFSWYNRGRQVVIDIARGLHYLHSLRVTHFDLKSGNVLFTKEFTAKLADVGLARVMSRTHHSLTDEAFGTFAYMAPELLAGSKCTQAVDIFSFGILMWEICTGTHPVRGRRLELRVPEDAPQEVADLYWACTAADPARRPSAREVVEALMRTDHPKQRQQRQQGQQQGQEAQQQQSGLGNEGVGQEEGPGGALGALTVPAGPGSMQSVHFQAARQVSPFQAVSNPNW